MKTSSKRIVCCILPKNNPRPMDLGKLTCCELLMQQGADIDSVDSLGRTSLHYACMNSNRMVACLLLNHGADPHALDMDEKTPMDVATEAQDRELLCVLKISQALRKFQPVEMADNSRFASSPQSARLARAPTKNHRSIVSRNANNM
ncbi:arf-GAP with coiled-coil, ANK repeat and PH domain-containing protein 3-like [Symsagittifera roscoffensis]|uniref:arf-GAP with coiled-coil, ANK repeat and PH domain-containing protein 3-like n=1 Tax=Symsagittifera roscoffensis TaxID=84072 RepID=UPI00307BB41E